MLQQGQPWKDCSSPFVNKAMLIWRWCTFFCYYLFCFRAIPNSAEHLLLTFHFGITPGWAWGIICVTWNWTWLVSNLPILLSVWLQRSILNFNITIKIKAREAMFMTVTVPVNAVFLLAFNLCLSAKIQGTKKSQLLKLLVIGNLLTLVSWNEEN